MLKIAVFVSGGGSNLQGIIDGIKDGTVTNTKVELVISDKEGVYALERAKKYGIDSCVISKKQYTSELEFSKTILELLAEREIELIVLAGYLTIVPKDIVKAYGNRIINVHPSLIPSFCGNGYYGLKVHQSVLDRGNKITGATVHFVDEGTDTGPIILQKEVYVQENDTKEVLQQRVMEEAEWIILPKAIDLFANHRLKINGSRVNVLEENKQ